MKVYPPKRWIHGEFRQAKKITMTIEKRKREKAATVISCVSGKERFSRSTGKEPNR